MSISTWEAETSYTDEIVYISTGDYWLECTTPGTSGESEPSAPSAAGDTVDDGTVQWTAIAISLFPRTDGESNLGSSSTRWETVFAETIDCDGVSFGTNLIPKTDVVSYLGFTSKRFLQSAARYRYGATLATENVRLFDFYHKAQQDQGSAAPLLGAFHDYTDSTGIWMDKVGSGTILNLNNANNSAARPDKDADYVGTADFIKCATWTGSSYRTTFMLDDDGYMNWNNGSTVLLKNDAPDDGLFGFVFSSTARRSIPFAFSNDGVTLIQIASQIGNTQAALKTAASSGMQFVATAGSLQHLVPSGKLHNWYVNYVEQMRIASGTIHMYQLPTSDPASAGQLWRDGNDLKVSTG